MNNPFFKFNTKSEKKIALTNVPENYMSPEQLRHLHSCIHFTHTLMKKESDAKTESNETIKTPTAADLKMFT